MIFKFISVIQVSFWKKRYEKRIIESIAPYNAVLIYYSYSAKYFGNMIVKIVDCFGQEHEFILDRGTVYADNECLEGQIVLREKGKDCAFDNFLKLIISYLAKIYNK